MSEENPTTLVVESPALLTPEILDRHLTRETVAALEGCVRCGLWLLLRVPFGILL